MKRHVPQEHKKSIMVKLVCGSVAGLLGQTFTYPLDVVRRQMQVMYIIRVLKILFDRKFVTLMGENHLNRFNELCHQTVQR